jgi:hypothetical protein
LGEQFAHGLPAGGRWSFFNQVRRRRASQNPKRPPVVQMGEAFPLGSLREFLSTGLRH